MTTSPAIVLVGFMGAGKSSALGLLGDLIEPAVDLDDLIEREVGKSVQAYFDDRGERAFREVEERVALAALNEARGGLIALGGGTVLSDKVRSSLAGHTVVWLDVGPETAWERVSANDDRPLARDRVGFDTLYFQRRPLYEELADVVLQDGDPALPLRALPAIRALTELPPGCKMLWATSASGEYPVLVGNGVLEGSWPLEGRRFCVTDSEVGDLYASRLGPLQATVSIPSGEASKSIEQVGRVLGELVSAGMLREDHVVALGGGVVGDLAGFCAHIFQRGVPVVQVPTSLVAQVDSAYGGKTGVDLPAAKNYVGAYHMPAAVLADTTTLRTLPKAELAAGFVEVIKTGLLAGGRLWERIRAIDQIDADDLSDVVFDCARFKCEIVAADERDGGLRQVLNLGHTVGHAIEAASGYSRYRHGEAVGLGLLAALRLSETPGLREEVEATLARHGLPTALDPAVDVEATLAALQRDKKRTAEGVGFVLLAEPGQPRIGQLVDPAKVRAAVEELQ